MGFVSFTVSVFLVLLQVQIIIASSSSFHSNPNRTFQIDYDKDVFLKDGKPFQYVSGSLHYFRVPNVYWQDRLRKYRAAGLNAVATYVEWSSHEPSPGKYQFDGDNDLEHFLDLAVKEDLLVILRPGPYICAERDFGGLPPWLLHLYPSIELRTDDSDFKKEVKRWFDVLMTRMKKYLYGNGGPIIMVQVENEYGKHYACNTNYKIWLKELLSSYVNDNAILFTFDEASPYLKCGAIPDVYATVNFGTRGSAAWYFANMREFTPKGPLVNSEFYPGWLTHWEEPLQRVSTEAILRKMDDMLALRASFNFYMFFGGTNFGFMNGANIDEGRYDPQITSYDFDAPLNEAGDPTDKYFAIRQLLSKHFEIPKIAIPKPTPKGNYGAVTLRPVLSVFNSSHIPDKVLQKSDRPYTFERLQVYYGYVLYEAELPNDLNGSAHLYVHDLRDRAHVFVDQIFCGILSRTKQEKGVQLKARSKAKLQLLVENQGRVNFGSYLKDFKGIISDPRINGRLLTPWTMTGLPFSSVSWVEKLTPSDDRISPPAYYYGELILPSTSPEPLHTHVDLTGWGKGVIFINGHNLGRYWPDAGPQVSLFVPASFLKPAPEINKIVVFETEKVAENYQIYFTNTSQISSIVRVHALSFSFYCGILIVCVILVLLISTRRIFIGFCSKVCCSRKQDMEQQVAQ
ncbi:beta-galactosidase-like isoform X1 [Planococcus citri]|uniref:beta-galactosidase-like isoform X1 n=1 Tax=Planococcus citri TaxID=170843 RepID=UPI0031F83E83